MAEAHVFDVPGPLQSARIVAPPGAATAQNAAGAARSAPARAVAAPTLAEQKLRLEEQCRDLEQAHAALDAAVSGIRALEAEIISGAESQLATLALEIAGKVLAQEIEGGKYRIEPIVQEALRRMPSRRDIVVRLNPQDLARWQEAGIPPFAAGVKLMADPSIRKAECLVECAEAVVSATVAESLAQAAQVFEKRE